MRIRLRDATHLASSLLLAAGLGVFSDAVKAQNPAANKPSSSAARRTAHGKKASKRSKRRERGQKAPTPDRISEIQQALAKNGSYTGTPSGKWDESTQDALRKFQESHGLNPTGKLDARSLQQLGWVRKPAALPRRLRLTPARRLPAPRPQGYHGQ